MPRIESKVLSVLTAIVLLVGAVMIFPGCIDDEDSYSLKIDIKGEGKVEVEPEKDVYDNGTEVNITAVPDEGWLFVEWTGDYNGTETEITIVIDADKEITAHFIEKEPGSPLAPRDPKPADEEVDVGDEDLNANLSVLVEHEAGRRMDVEFYDAWDDSLIGVDENVKSGQRANTTWEGLGNALKYEWYSVADDGEETARSEDWRFLTWGERELARISTDEADNITDTSATLHGTLEDLGTMFEVDVYFRWRESGDESWNETEKQTLNSIGEFQHELTGLEPETKYEFRAMGGDGGEGEVLNFTTESTGSPLVSRDPKPTDEEVGVGDEDLNANLSVLVEHEAGRWMWQTCCKNDS